MTERIERRLGELKAELEVGEALLADLESRRARVRSSMLRISGAIRVLEELLGEADPGDVSAVSPAEAGTERAG